MSVTNNEGENTVKVVNGLLIICCLLVCVMVRFMGMESLEDGTPVIQVVVFEFVLYVGLGFCIYILTKLK